MDTMKAARLDVTHHTLNVEEVPVPTPGPGQAVIEVKAAGVCLSDVHLLEGLIAPQFLDSEKVTLGHEVAGVVTALGDGVPTLPGEDRERVAEVADAGVPLLNQVAGREPCAVAVIQRHAALLEAGQDAVNQHHAGDLLHQRGQFVIGDHFGVDHQRRAAVADSTR